MQRVNSHHIINALALRHNDCVCDFSINPFNWRGANTFLDEKLWHLGPQTQSGTPSLHKLMGRALVSAKMEDGCWRHLPLNFDEKIGSE